MPPGDGKSARLNYRLPARVPVVRGETLGSLIRRLAAVNGLDRGALTHHLGLPRARVALVEAIAACVRVEPDELEASTYAASRRLYGHAAWRLKAPWMCQHCRARGIDDALIGLSVQFLCLRCGTFLVPESELAMSVRATVASVDDRRLQDEILDTCYPAGYRTSRRAWQFLHIVLAITASDSGPSDALARLVATDCTEPRRYPVGYLGFPEHPQIAAQVFRLAWPLSASRHTARLALRTTNGYQLKARAQRSKVFYGRSAIDLRGYMHAEEWNAIAPLTAGMHLRELMDHRGLRCHHVPSQVRYARDPLRVNTNEYCWRSYVCAFLRHWIEAIELTSPTYSPQPLRTGRPYVSRLHNVLVDDGSDVEAIVSSFPRQAATTFLTHMLCLAEDLVQKPTYATQSFGGRAFYSEQLAEFVERLPLPARSVGAAWHWMWVDAVLGQDAYGFVPACPPAELAAFDHSLTDADRDALRAYRGGRANW